MRVPRYRGVLNEEGGVDIEAPLRYDSHVAFEWRVRGEGFDHSYLAKLRCNSIFDAQRCWSSPRALIYI